MSILQRSSVELRERLLALFPAANLRASFSRKGSKEKICREVASSSSTTQLDAIARFVDENMTFCKQHVQVLTHSGDAIMPDSIPDGEQVLTVKGHALYLAKTTFKVVKLNPPANDSIDFLLPICIDLLENYLLVRFVVLEKNMSSYFGEAVVSRGRSLTEEMIVSSILRDGTLGKGDINRGIKALWSNDLIDAIRLRYETPNSSDTKNMHEEMGIKKHDPKAYMELQKYPLFMSTFAGYGSLSDVERFATDPSGGVIGFTRYSKKGESQDALIRQVLKNN